MSPWNQAGAPLRVPSGDLPPERARKVSNELRAFFEDFAPAFSASRAMRRAAERARVKDHPEPCARTPAAYSYLLVVAFAVLSISWAVATVVRETTAVIVLPEGTYGGWRTTDAQYRDRMFWIKGGEVAFQFGTNPMDFSVHTITQVTRGTLGPEAQQYTIEYVVEGTPTRLAIEFVERPEKVIRFLNQPTIRWTPRPESPWPEL